jgi:general secretion pathway protein B
MSYILDALKKSEKERQQGKVPSIDSQHESGGNPPSAKKRFSWHYGLFAVLLAGGIVLGLWMKPQQTEKTLPNGAEAVDGSTTRLAMEAEKQQPSASSVLKKPSAYQPSALGSSGEKMGVVKPDNIEPQSDSQEAPENARVADSDSPPLQKQASVAKEIFPHPESGVGKQSGEALSLKQGSAEPMEEVLDEKTEAEESEDLFTEQETPGLKVEQSQAPGPEETDKKEQDGAAKDLSPPAYPNVNEGLALTGRTIQEYSQLPGSLRQQLPELSISLLFYSKQPERRRVSVNGRMMREKDRLEKGLILEEITPDGVVFSYQGKKFHKAVFR